MLSVNTYYPGRKENQFEPSKTLFLGDLSYFCTEEDIFNLFAQYGPIASIRVQRGVSGEPLLHGYVVFHSPVSARQALMEADGMSFMGRKLRYIG
jgi:RNA recognition motif-containing protein